MARNISRTTKNFILWAQKDHCFLCSFRLQLHFHHLISIEDGGPNDSLNLVALCPNHHRLVEVVKRYIIPHIPRAIHHSKEWMRTATHALEVYNTLENEEKITLDILSKPHPLRREIQKVVNKKLPEDLIPAFANALREEDIKILEAINGKRPWIFLQPPLCRNLIRGPGDPYDLQWIDDINLQRQIDELATNSPVGKELYENLVTTHFRNINLPFVAVLPDQKLNA